MKKAEIRHVIDRSELPKASDLDEAVQSQVYFSYDEEEFKDGKIVDKPVLRIKIMELWDG